ncbi:FAD binding domain-containing protein [Halobellus rubicundus]|uniref:Xanthine dehydrogenase family protein subunit M n=1 Tax=Halobellus rubicundus TaxID=2996466 RepID=A0ABD5MF44_9EURY
MATESFEYARPTSIDRALELLEAHPGAEVLAAGQSLLPALRQGDGGPTAVIDIGAIEAMRGVECGDDVADVGALTTYATVHKHSELGEHVGALTEAVGKSADTQVRNTATIGGNLVTPYPVSDLSAAAVAGDATLVARSRDGKRHIDAETALTSPRAGLAGDELLTRITVPLHEQSTGSVYCKRPSPTSRYTLVGVAAHVAVEDRTVVTARIAATGVYDRVVRLEAVESALIGGDIDDVLVSDLASRAGSDLDPSRLVEDTEASASYRAYLVKIQTNRALDQSLKQATE